MVALLMPSEAPSSPEIPRRFILGILVGFGLYHVSMSFFWVFGSIYLFQDIGESSLILIGLVGGLPILISLVTVNFWGFISDRWQRRRPIMLFGFAAQIAAFTIYLFVNNSVTFLLVACLVSLFTAAAIPMANTYLTEARTHKGEAVGLLLASDSIGWTFGAFGGGFLYDIIGMNGLFLLGAIIIAVGGSIILIFVREIPHKTIKEMNPEKSLKPNDSGEADGNPRFPLGFLLTLCLAIGIGHTGVRCFAYFLGIYLVSEIGGTAAMIGIANGGATFTGLLVTFAAGYGSDRFGRKTIILLGYIGYTLFFLVYSTITNPWVATILWMMPFYPLAYTAAHSAAADISHSSHRGRAMTLVATAFSLGSGFGPIVGGAFVQFLFGTLRGNILLAAALNGAASLLVLFLVPETLRRARKH